MSRLPKEYQWQRGCSGGGGGGCGRHSAHDGRERALSSVCVHVEWTFGTERRLVLHVRHHVHAVHAIIRVIHSSSSSSHGRQRIGRIKSSTCLCPTSSCSAQRSVHLVAIRRALFLLLLIDVLCEQRSSQQHGQDNCCKCIIFLKKNTVKSGQ